MNGNKIIITGSIAATNLIVQSLLSQKFRDTEIICCSEGGLQSALSDACAVILIVSPRLNRELPNIPSSIPVLVYCDGTPEFPIPSSYKLIKVQEKGADKVRSLTDKLYEQLAPIVNGNAAIAETAQKTGQMHSHQHNMPTHTAPIQKVHTPEKQPVKIEPIRVSSSFNPSGKIKLIAIGASTGGTEAIIQVVKDLPANTPPVVIVQHMPPEGFTKMYADRLNRLCHMSAKEAEDGDRLKPGQIILAHGGVQMEVQRDGAGYYVKIGGTQKVSGHCPSVDVMFNSVSKLFKNDAIGVLLTGMGRDGADGLLKMRKAGSYTIGQDEATCVVYGMPKEAYDEGAVRKQLPLGEICNHLIYLMTEK